MSDSVPTDKARAEAIEEIRKYDGGAPLAQLESMLAMERALLSIADLLTQVVSRLDDQAKIKAAKDKGVVSRRKEAQAKKAQAERGKRNRRSQNVVIG